MLGWGCPRVLSADADASPEDAPPEDAPPEDASPEDASPEDASIMAARTGGWAGAREGQRSRHKSPFWSRPGCGAVASAAQGATGGTRRPRPPERSPQSHPRAHPNTTLIIPCLQNGPLRPAQGAAEKGVQRRSQGCPWGLSGGRPLSPVAR